MEIEYQLSKKDYIGFHKLYSKDLVFRRPWIPILFTVLLFFPLSGDGHNLWRALLALFISPILVFLIFFLVPFLISLGRLNRTIAKERPVFERKKISIVEEGLLIESEIGKNIRKWESFNSVGFNDRFIYLWLVDKKYFLIPKSAFSSEVEVSNFLGLIQHKFPFAHINGKSQINNFTTNKKPNYFRGLLGLIPVAGAVMGIIFIADGISKFKDKRFILIGLGGIVFNACIFLFCFYYFDFPIKLKLAFVPVSQNQVNTLLKDVEFYKLKNGIYPDSLGQLKTDSLDMSIYDPLLENEKLNKNSEYNYHKVGNHYYLFSSGVDGIPNTKDDIYPQVAESDTGKFGLIIKKLK